MKSSDINNINILLENQYRNMETMQPSASKIMRTSDQRRNPALSTPQWDGITDPAKGNMLNSFSVDEEQLDDKGKLKKLIQQELDVAPKKMTYAKRVLKKLLDQIDSL
jgi:hypothetical protein